MVNYDKQLENEPLEKSSIDLVDRTPHILGLKGLKSPSSYVESGIREGSNHQNVEYFHDKVQREDNVLVEGNEEDKETINEFVDAQTEYQTDENTTKEESKGENHFNESNFSIATIYGCEESEEEKLANGIYLRSQRSIIEILTTINYTAGDAINVAHREIGEGNENYKSSEVDEAYNISENNLESSDTEYDFEDNDTHNISCSSISKKSPLRRKKCLLTIATFDFSFQPRRKSLNKNCFGTWDLI